MPNPTPTTNPPLTTGQWKPITNGMAELVRALADAALAHPRNDHLRAWLAEDPQRAETFAAELAWLVLRGIALSRASARQLIAREHTTAAPPSASTPILNLTALRTPHDPTTERPELITDETPAFFQHPTIDNSAIDDSAIVIDTATAHDLEARITHFSSGPIAPTHDTRFLSLAYESTLAWSATLAHDPDAPTTPRLRLNPRTGKARHAAGAFSTPDALIQHVLAQTLEPTITERLNAHNDNETTLRTLRICDPAVGVGRFLIAAGWHLAEAIATRTTTTTQSAFNQLATQLVGVDNDPKAIALCRTALWLESNNPKRRPADFVNNIRLANALLGVPMHALPPDQRNQHTADAWCTQTAFGNKHATTNHPTPTFFHWPLIFPGGFDVIVGNPPFLNQLRTSTASTRWQTALLRARTDHAIRRYADVSAAFLMLALELARPHGRIGLVMPQSTLAAGDLIAVRQRTLELAQLESIWVSHDPVFPGTDVQACAITLKKHAPSSSSLHSLPLRGRAGERVYPTSSLSTSSQSSSLSPSSPSAPIPILHRTTGSTFQSLPPLELTQSPEALAQTWGPLIAEAFGVPTITLPQTTRTPPTIADLATATADFRDQYYGLIGHIIEHKDLTEDQHTELTTNPRAYPKLITSGLIALAHNQWSLRPTRIHKQPWHAPRINATTLRKNPALASWLDARLVPKLLVATQTRIIQAIADERGDLLPSVPVLTVVPHDPADLWKLAAAICSPVAAAIAMARYPGTALTRDAIKLSAKQLLTLPLPTNEQAWQEAAECFQRASHAATPQARERALADYAQACMTTHGLDPAEAESARAWWWSRWMLSADASAQARNTPA